MPEFQRWTNNARASPGGDACQQPPADKRSGLGVLRRPPPQLKKIVERNVKIGSWNVGSMTGRGRERGELCKRRNIRILCVQETKWTGKRARELGEGFKILYSGEKSSRNGVGVIIYIYIYIYNIYIYIYYIYIYIYIYINL